MQECNGSARACKNVQTMPSASSNRHRESFNDSIDVVDEVFYDKSRWVDDNESSRARRELSSCVQKLKSIKEGCRRNNIIEIQLSFPAHIASESSRAHHRMMDQHRRMRDVTRWDTLIVLGTRGSARRVSSMRHRNRWHRKHPQTGDDRVEVSCNLWSKRMSIRWYGENFVIAYLKCMSSLFTRRLWSM